MLNYFLMRLDVAAKNCADRSRGCLRTVETLREDYKAAMDSGDFKSAVLIKSAIHGWLRAAKDDLKVSTLLKEFWRL